MSRKSRVIVRPKANKGHFNNHAFLGTLKTPPAVARGAAIMWEMLEAVGAGELRGAARAAPGHVSLSSFALARTITATSIPSAKRAGAGEAARASRLRGQRQPNR
jgi:hypothetical protein